MIGEASTISPEILLSPPKFIENSDLVFEENSDVERLVEEVLQHEDAPAEVLNSFNNGFPFYPNSDNLNVNANGNDQMDEDVVVISSDSFSDSMSVSDANDEMEVGATSSCDEDDEEGFVDPYELLHAIGVKAFVEEQRVFGADPRELFAIFELEIPSSDDNAELWGKFEEALEEVYASCMYSSASSGDEMVELDGGVQDKKGQDERLTSANSYLLELRQKGPLQFADDHSSAGTSASSFLSDLGFRLPRSMQYLEHGDQWSFIKRFLIKYVYQRPRKEDLTTFEHAVECIRKAKKILIVTGAGISVSCGIPDFRSEDGLYASIRERFALPEPECMFDIEYFRDDPAPFFMLAKELFPGKFKPSVSHYFIRELEKVGKLLRNYTQNIDTLEQVAGIERAVYCHGSFASATCIQCRTAYTVDELRALMEADTKQGVPYCEDCEEGVVKPDIVFFGEPLPQAFDAALEADIGEADLVLVIGSSMKVQPVSMIPDLICPSVPQILINRERLDHHFDIELLGDADTILSAIAQRLAMPIVPETRREEFTEFVPPNVTLFSGNAQGHRPAIPEPLMDGSLMAEAFSPVQQDSALSSLVHAIFPKPQ